MTSPSSDERGLRRGEASACRTRTSPVPGRPGHVGAPDARPTCARRATQRSRSRASCPPPHAEMPVPRLQNAIVGSAIRSPAPTETSFHMRARTPNVGGTPRCPGPRSECPECAPGTTSSAAAAQRNIAVREVLARMRARRQSAGARATARSSRCRPPRAVRDHRRAYALVRLHRLVARHRAPRCSKAAAGSRGHAMPTELGKRPSVPDHSP